MFAKVIGLYLGMEFSSILDCFLQTHKDNYIEARVARKQKRRVGLVVLVQNTAHTKNRKIAAALLLKT